jgi:hypothetical protein
MLKLDNDLKASIKARLDHYLIPKIPGENYLLLCDGAPVTVRSQQIRALNLLSALHAHTLLKDARRKARPRSTCMRKAVSRKRRWR